MSEPVRRDAGRRVFALALLGILLCQAAWVLALPPYRGLDEFDHVYKAAAVARGEWRTSGAAPDGRGGLVTIPGDIVAAASKACASRPYTGHDNCHPAKRLPDGLVQVATAAGNYNPAYYLVVGTATRPFTGNGVVLAMRALTALGCALLLAWAAATTLRWATNAWPLVAIALAASPVLVYSTTIAGPNGLQYAAAVLVWTSVLGLAGTPEGDSTGYLAPLGTGSVVVLLAHSTGPLWLALIAVLLLVLRPPQHWWRVVRTRPAPTAVAAAGVVLAALFTLGWTHAADTNALGPPIQGLPSARFGDLVGHELFWAFQSVAAFPMRGEQAPMFVYVAWVCVFVTAAVALFRCGTTRQRATAALLLVLCVVVPAVLSLPAYPSEGWAWQGRYALPISAGLPLLAGHALSRRRRPAPAALVGVVVVVLAAAMTVSVVAMAQHESARFSVRPLAMDVPAGWLLLVVLTGAGCVLPWLAGVPARTDVAETAQVPA